MIEKKNIYENVDQKKFKGENGTGQILSVSRFSQALSSLELAVKIDRDGENAN